MAQVLRYIQNNPNVPLKDVPHLSRTRGAAGRNPDGILYQVLHQGLSAIWDIIPKGILESCSAIELFRFFVSLKPLNPTAVLKELRDRVMDAGTPGAEIQPVRDLKYRSTRCGSCHELLPTTKVAQAHRHRNPRMLPA